MSRLRKSAAAGALAVSLVGGFEGLRLAAYPDPATQGYPWTICYGETSGVQKGDKRSLAQCKAMLVERLDEFGNGVEKCITRPMTDTTEIAFISLAYNIGIAGFCKSSVVRLYNGGYPRASCDAMMKFNRAAGVVFPGLVRRRKAEHALCVRDL